MPFEIVRNDITRMNVDAIVNAANRSLLGGGGVDGAIHRAAGPGLLEECRGLGGCETGQAKITRGYRLSAKYVIHTVGPIWHGGGYNERALLTACYRNSLALAVENDSGSVAFPLISAGAYGYPKAEAMDVAVEAIARFLEAHDLTVYLVVFGDAAFLEGKKLFRDVRAYIDDVYAETCLPKGVEHARRTMWEWDESAALQMDQAFGEALADAYADASQVPTSAAQPDWDNLLRQADEGFSEALMRLIDERGMTDAQCYKRANVDRKLFSKIRSNPAYRPSKPTVFAFAVALELTLPQTKRLLGKAGFALSHSSKFDIILEYFIKSGNYNVFEINEVLFRFDMPLLGSGTAAV